MKATLVDPMPTGAWIYEIKLDGYRALALRGGTKHESSRGTKRILAKSSRL
jgi:ATP-dependent DNA ligase